MSKACLWLLVLVLGIEIGAGIYEALVVVPHWASAAPQSVVDYYRPDAASPQFALRPGEHFWMVNTPLVGLLALATLLTSRGLAPEHRKWRMIGAGVALAVVISTFVWFVPTIMKMMSSEVTRMDGQELASLAGRWVVLNWVRAFAYVGAWICTLKALTIPERV